MTLLKKLFPVFLLLALVACGDDDDDEPAPAAAPAPQAPADTPTPVAPPTGTVRLLTSAGTFRSGAVTTLSRRAGGTACSTYEINAQGTQLTIHQRTFDDSNCSDELLGEIILTGTIAELQPTSTSTHNYNLVIQSARMITRSNQWADEFGDGTSGECAVETMPLGVETDVAGKSCDILGDFPAVGQVFLSRYQFTSANTVMMTFAPHELPNSIADATNTTGATRTTNLNVRYQRVTPGTASPGECPNPSCIPDRDRDRDRDN